tara:strand:- start:416 stop:691 length:276 start_codon:yes stop_codon:yes gene_type:complete
MSVLNRHYLTPLRGRLAFSITTAIFSIYIYNNYDNLPSYQELKSRFIERYFKPETTDSEQQCSPTILNNQESRSPNDTPLATTIETEDDNK